MASSYHEDHGKVAGTDIEGGRGNNKANDGNNHRPDGMERRVLELIGRPVVRDRDGQAQHVRGHSEQEGVDGAEAQGLDNSREEVGRGACNLDAEKDQCKDIQTPVLECHLEAIAPPFVVLVHLSSIGYQPPLGHCTLFGAQPGSVRWVVWQNEECEQRKENGRRPFNDEDPSPRLQTPCAVETTGDTGPYESGECTSKLGAREEKGTSHAHLGPLVPG